MCQPLSTSSGNYNTPLSTYHSSRKSPWATPSTTVISSTAPKAPTTTSPLSKLPREIRHMIWAYAFTETTNGILPLQRVLCASNKELSLEVLEIYRKRMVFHLSTYNVKRIEEEASNDLLKSVRCLNIYTGGRDRPSYPCPRRSNEPLDRYLGSHLSLSSYIRCHHPFPSLTNLSIRVLTPTTNFNIHHTIKSFLLHSPLLVRIELEFSVLDRSLSRKYSYHKHHDRELCKTLMKMVPERRNQVLEDVRGFLGRESGLGFGGKLPWRVGRAVWQARKGRVLSEGKEIVVRNRNGIEMAGRTFQCGCEMCELRMEREWDGCCEVEGCGWCVEEDSRRWKYGSEWSSSEEKLSSDEEKGEIL